MSKLEGRGGWGESMAHLTRGLAARLRAGAANGHTAGAVPRAGGQPPAADDEPEQPRPPRPLVPEPLLRAAAWALCLLLVAGVAYLAFRMAEALRLLVLPFVGALLLTALLQPLTARLKRAGLPALAATWGTLLVAIAVLAGITTLLVNRVQAEYPRLLAQAQRTAHEVQSYLAGSPFHLNSARIGQLSGKLLTYLEQHRALVAGTVLTGGRYLIELLTGMVLTVFITFFLLKDGHRIWNWLTSGFGPAARMRVGRAGEAAWHAVVSYVRGTTAVAAIHALVIGFALWLLGVPLLVPLVILVFLAAYVPLVGILVVGALAILVTLATRGWVAALILLAVLLAENQLESHLLQPLVVGRVVRLHPLAIIMVLTVGGIVAGVPGAVVAVPVAAATTSAWPYLRKGG